MIYFSDLLFSRQSIIPGFKRMTDIVYKETRSRMMSGIRGKNTKPEILIRKGLHALGFRYRLHSSKLPGKPDIVLPRYRAIILINGCFWHAHNCHLFKYGLLREKSSGKQKYFQIESATRKILSNTPILAGRL